MDTETSTELVTLDEDELDYVTGGVLDVQAFNIAANVLAAFRNNAQNINDSAVIQS